MTLVAAMFAVCASAQVYVGGNVGITSVNAQYKNEGYEIYDDDETCFKFLPEVGYKFNDDWAVGIMFGWSKDNVSVVGYDDKSHLEAAHTFEINPYVRYTFFHSKLINVFCDGGFGYKHYNGKDTNTWSIGLRPGIELKLNKFSFVAHVGFIGWEQTKTDVENRNNDYSKKVSTWGMDFDGNNISLGVYYNF